MGYIGATPSNAFINNDVQRVTNSTNNYVDLDHNISSLDSVIVFVNNVRQESTNLTFTSASRITLGDTLTTSDVVEIVFIGKAVATQSAAANSITNDMLAGSIANSKLANSSITLNGSAVSLGGSATVTPSVTPDNWQYFSLGSNTSQLSSATQSVITGWGTPSLNSRLLYNFGTQYTSVSSGIFSFSTEGYYKILFRASGSTHGATEYNSYLDTTTDNSSYGDAIDLNGYASTGAGFNFILEGIFKITDTSNHKVRFSVYPHSANMTFAGNTTRMRTYCRFERLGTTA